MKEENRSLAINSFYSVIYKVINVLYPLITTTYVARILLADGCGKVAYAQNVVQYFITIASLGIPNYGIREVAKVANARRTTNRLFTELIIINTIATTVCIFAYYTMIFRFAYFERLRPLYCITGISLVMNYFNVDWFYQGREQYAYIAKRNCIVKVISLILILVLVKNTSDYIKYALVYSLAIAGNNIFNVINLHGKVNLVFPEVSIVRHLKPVFILLASTISIELYTLVDTTMLGVLCTDEIVGYYSNSVKLARVINSTISSITVVLLPRLSYYYYKGELDKLSSIANKVLYILISLTVPATIGLSLLSRDIIPVLFGDSFMPAVTTLQILAVLVFAVALNNYFGPNMLLIFGREDKFLISVVIGAIINITLNSFLIPNYAHNGAAVASVISELCVLMATYHFAKKSITLRLSLHFLLSLSSSLLLMIGCLLLVRRIGLPTILELVLGLVVGVLSYMFCGLIMKNDGVINIIKAMKAIVQKVLPQ